MIYRLLLSSMTLFSLAMCQNQNIANSEKSEVKTTSSSTSTTTVKNDEPKMAPGMPPDEKALETADQEQATSNQTNVVYLKEGENKFLKEYEMNVTFKRLVEDSRCPKGVQCIWAGNAMAEVEFMGTYTRPVTMRLSTMNDTGKNYVQTQNFNGYEISLVDVTPETTSAKGFKDLKGTYKIALQFKKEGQQDSSTKKGGTTTK